MTPDYMQGISSDPTGLKKSTFNGQEVTDWAARLRPGDTSGQYQYLSGYNPVTQSWAQKPKARDGGGFNALTGGQPGVAAPPSMVFGQPQVQTAQAPTAGAKRANIARPMQPVAPPMQQATGNFFRPQVQRFNPSTGQWTSPEGRPDISMFNALRDLIY